MCFISFFFATKQCMPCLGIQSVEKDSNKKLEMHVLLSSASHSECLSKVPKTESNNKSSVIFVHLDGPSTVHSVSCLLCGFKLWFPFTGAKTEDLDKHPVQHHTSHSRTRIRF